MKRYIKELANDLVNHINNDTLSKCIPYAAINDFNYSVYKAYSLYSHGLINEHECARQLMAIWQELDGQQIVYSSTKIDCPMH